MSFLSNIWRNEKSREIIVQIFVLLCIGWFLSWLISNVDATNTANQDPNYAAGQWATDNSGVSLGLSHATGASVDISDFSAPNYHHGWIYAAGSVSMTNVDLGSGWANNHYFDVMPFGSSGSTAGATGADATFDNVNVAN